MEIEPKIEETIEEVFLNKKYVTSQLLCFEIKKNNNINISPSTITRYLQELGYKLYTDFLGFNINYQMKINYKESNLLKKF